MVRTGARRCCDQEGLGLGLRPGVRVKASIADSHRVRISNTVRVRVNAWFRAMLRMGYG